MKSLVSLFISTRNKAGDGYEWGGVFAMNPGEKFLSEEEYTSLIEEIRKYL
jgi:hypothetical protein